LETTAKALPPRIAVCYARGVKATPGTLQEGGASFATPHRSVVAQSALTDVPEAANTLAQLCELHWPPIFTVSSVGVATPRLVGDYSHHTQLRSTSRMEVE